MRSALAVAALLALSGCSAELLGQWQRGGLLEGMSNRTERLTDLWVGSWVAAVVVGLIVWALILYAVVAYRRRPGETGLPAQVRYNVPVEVMYTAVPFVIVLVFFYFTVREETFVTETTSDYSHQVNVVGQQWSWTFNYLDEDGNPIAYEIGTMEERPVLYLPEDENVRFTLESRDVAHSFWIPQALYKLDLYPERVNVFHMAATEPGVYAGKCAELCGENHSRMLFDVAVVSEAEYLAYLEQLIERGQEGAIPADLAPNRLNADRGDPYETTERGNP